MGRVTTDARAVQTVTLDGYPSPRLLRVLAPNGGIGNPYAVWRAREHVKGLVALACRAAGIRPYAGLVDLRACFEMPDRRRRDVDNLTATLKPVLDGLVKEHIVPDDDVRHLALHVDCTITPGVRRLVLTLTGEAAA